MRVTRYPSLTDTVPQAVECSWDEFASTFGPHYYDFAPDAKFHGALPMFSPAEIRTGGTRLDEFVLRVWFGVLDIEHVTGQQLLDVLAKVEGLNAFLYTSWNHARDFKELGHWRVRIVIEFSRPLDAKEWRLFWPRFAGYFGSVCDPKCKALSMAYYGPFAPPGTEHEQHWIIWHGKPLDVDALRAAPTVQIQGSEKIARDRLERLAQKWRRSRDEWRATMGELLRRVCDGEPYAEAGERDTRTFQLCQDLAEQFPAAIPLSLAEHFAPSLSLMGSDAPSVDDVAKKIERAQATRAQEAALELEAEITESKLRIRQAFAPTDPTRDWPYTEEEIQGMAEKIGCAREELSKRWLVQRGNLFYVLGPGGKYSERYTDKDVMNAIVRDLAPARSAGVDLWWRPENAPPIRKTLQALMSDYGTVATSYHLDLRAQETTYETFQRIMVEAPCPRRPLTPQYDRDVATWLELMCGSYLHVVNSWLAFVTDLDSTCVALMFTGPKDTGKSLFAHGISRIWRTSGPVAMTSAMDPSFNEAISKCPLIFADEQLPKDWKGHGRTAEIREFIAARTRPFKGKWLPETVIIGATRLVIAANNEDILAIQENLNINDIEAIGDRFLHVRVNQDPTIIDGQVIRDAQGHPVPKAAYWLQYLGQEACETFVTEDRIARHALWLRDNLKAERNGRFLIKPPDRNFVRALSTKTGIRSAVCQWLVGYLREPARTDAGRDWRVRISRGRLLVTSKGILDNWSLYVPQGFVPETGRLNTAVVGLSRPDVGKDGRHHLAIPNGGSRSYREIDIDHVIAWAVETEYATVQEIRHALSLDTETRTGQK